MKRSLQAVLLVLLFLLTSADACQVVPSGGFVKILRPRFDGVESHSPMTIQVDLAQGANLASLLVRLNGHCGLLAGSTSGELSGVDVLDELDHARAL